MGTAVRRRAAYTHAKLLDWTLVRVKHTVAYLEIHSRQGSMDTTGTSIPGMDLAMLELHYLTTHGI